MRQIFGAEVTAFLERKGYRLVGDTLDLFIEEFVFAKHLAAEQLLRNASHDWKEDPKAKDFAVPELLVSDGKVDAVDMFERYADEAQIDDKTRRSWRTKVRSLMTFVGHHDLSRLTTSHVIAWKDKLLKNKEGAVEEG
jgi:hypothetical protein